MLKRILFSAGVVLSASALAAEPVCLAERGKPAAFTIVLPAQPSAAQDYAATELQTFTREMTGVTLPIVRGTTPVTTAGRLELGLEREAALGEDGFRIRTQSNRVTIVGSSVRGTLYGVYEILERFGGCRWYDSKYSVIPKTNAFKLPAGLDYAETPAFACRELFYSGCFGADNDFAARLRLNAPVHNPKPKHGGNAWRYVNGLGNCHTFERLVPWRVYGKAHPEYFSMRDGKRPSLPPDADAQHKMQLCLTNPDVYRLVVSNVLASLRRDPTARFVGVSQNDNEIYCQCPACAAIDAEEGSPSGSNIRFVNAVADVVAREFPDVIVETLAYNHTRHMPKKTRPRDNVMPCLCSIECDFSRPFSEPGVAANRNFMQDIAGWSGVTKRLYVWDYVTDFGFFPHPFPNAHALQENLRLFRKHHAVDMLEQGACKGRFSGFGALRTWLLAKWLWNPDLPAETLVADFCAGYYGAGAVVVREIWDEAHRLNADYYRGSTNRMMSFSQRIWEDDCRAALPDEFFTRASDRLAQVGRTLAASSAAHARHVADLRLTFDTARAARLLDDLRNIDRNPHRKPKKVDKEEMRTRMQSVKERLAARGNPRIMTWKSWNDYLYKGWDDVLKIPAQQPPLVDSVNPFIGAVTYPENWQGFGTKNGHGFGKTFPGAATPFGGVQLSPDTITGGDNGSGYSYTHKTIQGFSLLHMSGIGWYGEFGNFLVMPATGPRELDRDRAASPFSHADESASAGYYRVRLTRYDTLAELTASPHCGFLRFTFPTGVTARVQVDLKRRIGEKDKSVRHTPRTCAFVGDRRVEGSIVCDARDGGWGAGGGHVNYTLYYAATFSEPFRERALWDDDVSGFYAEFGTLKRPLEMKVAVSFASLAEARRFLAHEADGVSFDVAHTRARTLWHDAFKPISVTGGSARERRIFATALYHAMLDPRAIGVGTNFTRRTVFSGWDVFRSEMPLLTLIRPDVVADTIRSMMDVMASGKRRTLPRWDIFGCRSGCMLGQPILPVMACAYEAGVRSFDLAHAIELGEKSMAIEAAPLRRLGYFPDALSATLEYAYDEWCLGRLKEFAGDTVGARQNYAYAQRYTNCWSTAVGWMRARTEDGGWLPWKGRAVEGQGCVESNPWQQGWFVPHDVQGLIDLMGGKERFTRELDAFFAHVPEDFRWNAAYNHPNEPCHHIPFLYAWSATPEKVGRLTRKICEKAYGDDPYGLCGNDDVGQMSAWYVLAALGLHPICPGDGKWYLTAPLFPSARLDRLEIVRRDLPQARLNGKALNRPYLTTAEIQAGGVLEL